VIEPDQVLWSAPEAERAGRPLLVLLHGHGMNEQIGFDLRHRLPSELVVASVRGPLRAHGGYGWFPLDASLRLPQIDDVSRDLLDWLSAQPELGAVGILGFSQGSAVAIQCLRLEPSRFACGALLSGFIVPFPARGDAQLSASRPPIFSGRGSADGLVPRMLVQATEAWLHRHATLTSKTYPGLGHNVTDAEIADLAKFLEQHLVRLPKADTA
jgi:phospholipase/carboxylesterase